MTGDTVSWPNGLGQTEGKPRQRGAQSPGYAIRQKVNVIMSSFFSMITFICLYKNTRLKLAMCHSFQLFDKVDWLTGWWSLAVFTWTRCVNVATVSHEIRQAFDWLTFLTFSVWEAEVFSTFLQKLHQHSIRSRVQLDNTFHHRVLDQWELKRLKPFFSFMCIILLHPHLVFRHATSVMFFSSKY